MAPSIEIALTLASLIVDMDFHSLSSKIFLAERISQASISDYVRSEIISVMSKEKRAAHSEVQVTEEGQER